MITSCLKCPLLSLTVISSVLLGTATTRSSHAADETTTAKAKPTETQKVAGESTNAETTDPEVTTRPAGILLRISLQKGPVRPLRRGLAVQNDINGPRADTGDV